MSLNLKQVISMPPTVDTIGSNKLETFNPGGTGNNFSVGMAAEDRDEFVLQKNTKYLLRITNVSNSAQTIGIIINVHEEDV